MIREVKGELNGRGVTEVKGGENVKQEKAVTGDKCHEKSNRIRTDFYSGFQQAVTDTLMNIPMKTQERIKIH